MTGAGDGGPGQAVESCRAGDFQRGFGTEIGEQLLLHIFGHLDRGPDPCCSEAGNRKGLKDNRSMMDTLFEGGPQGHLFTRKFNGTARLAGKPSTPIRFFGHKETARSGILFQIARILLFHLHSNPVGRDGSEHTRQDHHEPSRYGQLFDNCASFWTSASWPLLLGCSVRMGLNSALLFWCWVRGS